MEKTFNPKDYIKCLGEELVYEFTKAGMTTHPHSVGGGRENSARTKLKAILPEGIGVGSGFVIDSFGNTSNQCDIILYEENYVMKFIVNDDVEHTYYNCESVIAVGEVKSDAGSKEIKDAVEKLKKIKVLRRYHKNGYGIRKYFTSLVILDALDAEGIEHNSNEDKFGQIYTFLICQKLNVSTENVLKIIREFCDKIYMYPNRIISTEGAYIGYLNAKNPSHLHIEPSCLDATQIYNLVDNKYAFNYFINDLLFYITNAHSVPLDYSRYIEKEICVGDLKESIDLY